MTEPHPPRLSADELADRVGIDVDRIDRLVAAGAIAVGNDGLFEPGDLHRIRLLNAFEEAGVPLAALVAASQAGMISLAYYDQLHPPPGPLSERSYGEFARSLGDAARYLPRLFAAFSLAEPESHTRLNTNDELLIQEVLDIALATGQPDLALRAIRLFGEGARRSADGALSVYGEAVSRFDGDVRGLPLDDVFERLLRPWARFARRSDVLASWLAGHHLSRAIDDYSVTETERQLEEGGFLAPRLEKPPAVAFVDLTEFTRMTEEQGDDAAAGMALRLGDISAEIAGRRSGRVVKLLGDGVLVRFDDAEAAIDGALDMLDALPQAGLPAAHAGVVSGPLVVRDGDVFGRTVNMAARIADVAPSGRLYVPEAVARVVGTEGLRVEATGTRLLQGIGQVTLFDVSRDRA